MDKRRIGISDIVIGEPLQWDAYGEGHKLLLRKGQIVQSIQQVEALLERGLYVDSRRADKSPSAEEIAKRKETPSVVRWINSDIKRLERLLYGLSGEPEAQAKILDVAKTVISAVDLNPDIALACVFLNQSAAHYAVRHCIDTGVVATLVARGMQKPLDEILTITAAALTMNVGMLRLQDQLQARPGALAEKEIEIIKQHPRESVTLLKQAGIDNQDWLSYVLLHHESGDGSGYPLGAAAKDIPQNARILALADQYCACVAHRKYRKMLQHGAAIRDVFLVAGKARDPMLSAYFIKALGTYPPGTFVRLRDGEIAVVTGRGESPATPIAHALLDPRGAALSYPIQRDTARAQFSIREPLADDQATLRFSLQQLWGEQASL